MDDFIRKVKIYKGTTSVRLLAKNNFDVCQVPRCNLFRFLMNNLTEYDWDPRLKRRNITYKYYVLDNNGYLRIPVNLLKDLVRTLDMHRVPYEIEEVPCSTPAKCDLATAGHFIPREGQEEFVDFLIDETAAGSSKMRAIQLGCGGGKTAIGLLAGSDINLRMMIVVPPSLNEQWAVRIKEYMPDVKIAAISGNKSIMNIIENDYKIDADILLCSVKTLAQYAKGDGVYENFPPLDYFVNQLGVGIKLVDECHLNFHANTMIELCTNVRYNFYLSATYSRGKASSKKIFNLIYPDVIRLMAGDKMDHINTTNVRYYCTSFDIPAYLTGTNRGYSQVKYEKFLHKNIHFFDKLVNRVLLKVINKFFISIRSKGQKLCILVGLKQTAYELEKRLGEIYQSEKVRAYLGEHSDDVLEEATMIISTPGSMGVGKDVKGLRTLIAFVSVVSEAEAFQHPGRLRPMENGDVPEYVYMTNLKVGHHDRHREIKEKLYRDRSRTFNSISI